MVKAKTEEKDVAMMWDRLEPTDPKYTKPFKGKGGFSGTAINATYIIKKLTEEFGPCGIGWKLVMDDEQIVDGHKLKSGDTAKLHMVRCHLEYRPEALADFVATSPQFGQTMLVDENKYGTFMDEEAPKKSITDCLSKCAVLLGIAADVHLGLFDDNKYVNQRRAEEAAEAAETTPAPPQAKPSTPAPTKADAPKATQTPAMPDKDFAKTTFFAIRDMVKNATDNQDIDDCLSANAKGLKVIEAHFPGNYEKNRDLVKAKRATFAGKPAEDDFLDDEIPA